ncbi:transmembrane amino acid transporter family protein [Actinidia rufa]|uniref:Transmembrane amino acid transporter family protein n=1 Tax=Actinidia rufa TaxID=165716 RepID=A0A7J0FHH1_9ERIC|nr:transmembrane amino acid transporter family protein [Actinidia rufa]
MADRENETQFFLEEEEDDDVEYNKNIDDGRLSSHEDIGKGGEEATQRRTTSPSSPFSSRQWPQSFRETADSYTIAVSPIFGSLHRASSARYSVSDIGAKTNLDLGTKTPLLSEYEKSFQKEDLDRISIAESSWSEKASLHEQLTGELPTSHGCSFTQTVFNEHQGMLANQTNEQEGKLNFKEQEQERNCEYCKHVGLCIARQRLHYLYKKCDQTTEKPK